MAETVSAVADVGVTPGANQAPEAVVAEPAPAPEAVVEDAPAPAAPEDPIAG